MPKMNDDNRDSNTKNPHDRGRRRFGLHDTVPILVNRSMAACGCCISLYQIRLRYWRSTACETV